MSAAARAEGRAAAISADLLCWVVMPLLAVVATPFHLLLRPAARQADLAAALLFLLVLLFAAAMA